MNNPVLLVPLWVLVARSTVNFTSDFTTSSLHKTGAARCESLQHSFLVGGPGGITHSTQLYRLKLRLSWRVTSAVRDAYKFYYAQLKTVRSATEMESTDRFVKR